MKLVYPGPHLAVDVPAAGLINVGQGVPVEVADNEIAAQLIVQGWTKARKTKEGSR